jgi:hypothetical protein
MSRLVNALKSALFPLSFKAAVVGTEAIWQGWVDRQPDLDDGNRIGLWREALDLDDAGFILASQRLQAARVPGFGAALNPEGLDFLLNRIDALTPMLSSELRLPWDMIEEQMAHAKALRPGLCEKLKTVFINHQSPLLLAGRILDRMEQNILLRRAQPAGKMKMKPAPSGKNAEEIPFYTPQEQGVALAFLVEVLAGVSTRFPAGSSPDALSALGRINILLDRWKDGVVLFPEVAAAASRLRLQMRLAPAVDTASPLPRKARI